jgi:CrcB protein
MRLLAIICLGVCGVLARYLLGMFISKHVITTFPAGTFIINMVGAFLIGIAYVVCVERAALSEVWRLGFLVGFLGGLTTFSSFSLETTRLLEESKYWYAAAYFFLSPTLGLAATLAGTFLTRFLIGGGL